MLLGSETAQANNPTSGTPAASGTAPAFRHAWRPYVVRLLVWMVLLNAGMLVIRFLPEAQGMWRNTVGHALLELCGALISGGVAYCLWVQYRVSTNRQMLLATVAFSGIMTGHMVHGLTSASSFSPWQSASIFGHQFFGVWRFIAGLLLIIAARETARDDRSTCRRFGLRMIWGSQIALILLAGSFVLLSRGHLSTHLHLTATELWGAHLILSLIRSSLFVHVLDAATMLVGLVVFTQRYLGDEDAFNDAIIRCLVLALSSTTAQLVSRSEYDVTWWVSHVFGISALLVLLIELGREFGASYSDAQSRIDHLEAVYRVSSQLGTTLDLRVVLMVLASDIADMLQARFSSVMLVDDSGEMLRTVATHGLPESPIKRNEPQKIEGSGRPGFYSGHTARAFREKRICMADDVFTDVEFVPWKQLANCNGYAVSVPLVYQGVALGVLNLFFDSHVPVNAERMRLFEMLATAAAVAIANAQLYDHALEAHPSESDTANLFRLRLAS